MKKILLLFMISSPSLAQNLAEVQQLAVKNSARIQVLQAELKESESRLQETSFLRRPNIGVAGGGEFEATRREQELLPIAYAYVNYVLYEGGQASIQQNLARKEIEMREQELPFSAKAIENAVEALFLDLAFAEEKLKVLDKEVAHFDRLKAAAKKRQSAGLIGDSDVLEFDLRRSELLLEKEEAEGARTRALKALALLAGRELTPRGQSLPLFEGKLEAPQDNAPATSQETLRLVKEKEVLELEKARQQASWQPRVEFEARAGRLPSEGEEYVHEPRVDALLVAKWDIFGRGLKNAAMMSAVARETTLSARLKESERIRTERLLEIRGQTELLTKKYAIHKRRLGPAKKYYQVTLEEFERGIKNAPDVAHAADMLWEAEMKELEFRHEAALRQLEWKLANFSRSGAGS